MHHSTIITLPVDELRPALQGLGKVMSKSPTLPVLATVRISRDPEGWVHLTTTDLDTFTRVRLEQPSPGEPASALVPHSDLVRLVKSQPNQEHLELLLSDREEAPVLRYPVGTQKMSLRIEPIPDSEFPQIPAFHGEEIPLDPSVRSSLLEALACASSDASRCVLQGAFIDTSRPDAHYLVGTDGRCLYSANSFQLPLAEPVIIPDRKFLVWRPFLADGEWRLSIEPIEKGAGGIDKPGWVRISSRRWSLISKAIDGNYPNYRQVIPQSETFKTEIKLGSEGATELLDALTRLPGEEVRDKPVTLYKENKTLWIKGHHPDGQKAERLRINAEEIEGHDITITLNREYALRALRYGLTSIQFIDQMSPIRFSAEGRQLIVMPLRTREHDPSPPANPAPLAEPAPPEPHLETTERNPMPENQHPNTEAIHTEPAKQHDERLAPADAQDRESENKPAIEAAIERLDVFKSSLRETLGGVSELAFLLKQAVREQRSEAKEIRAIRDTLRTLRGVKF